MFKNFLKNIISQILTWQAKIILKKYKPNIIAVTGSVGKTSTKDAIFAAFSQSEHIRKSDKSFNSEIGLPLAVLGAPNGWNNPVTWLKTIWQGFKLIIFKKSYPKWLVLEVGVRKPGDIKRTAGWLKTKIVVITAFADIPPHVEFFRTAEDLFAEKVKLIETLALDGTLILNYDDKRVIALKPDSKHKVVTFGENPNADILISNDVFEYTDTLAPKGMAFRIDYSGASIPIFLNGLLGRAHMNASAGALATAYAAELNMVNAASALEKLEGPNGRMKLIPGIRNSQIIDDTYNSSPMAAESALDVLKALKPSKRGHRIAVLGDMLELGRYAKEAHEALGAKAKKCASILICVGVRAKHIVEGALAAGMKDTKILHVMNSMEAGEALLEIIKEGDIILIKGSQGMRMERTVEAIMANPQDKDKLLVRQEYQWINKK